MTRRRAALVALVTLAACAHRLDELEPYPCASDNGACPDGRACRPDVGCVMPTVDGPCSDFTDCTLADADARCIGGVCPDVPGQACAVGMCVLECAAGLPCPEGRLCATLASAGGACLDDCTLDGRCGHGLGCRPLPGTGRFGCLPVELVLPLCESVDVTGTCMPPCGDPFGFSTVCDDGATACARDSTCPAGTSQCTCNPGLAAFDCQDIPCGPDHPCEAPDWYCRAPGATLAPACEDSLARVSGTCVCASGVVPFSCGFTGTCNDLCNGG